MKGRFGMEYKFVEIEGNECEIRSGGVVIATVYTSKDTYKFDIEQMVEAINNKMLIKP